MKPSEALEQHRQAIREIVAANRGLNPRVFGSVLCGEDTEESDLDILVDRTEGMSLFDLGGMVYELEELLGVPVDVLTPGDLPNKWRDKVIAEAKPV
jgi:predicted nucleotidyltransferase